VVVKVVHPGLRPLVACDLAVLRFGMWALGRLMPGSEWFRMDDALDNFSYTLTGGAPLSPLLTPPPHPPGPSIRASAPWHLPFGSKRKVSS